MADEEMERCGVCGKGSWSALNRPGRCPICNSPVWNRNELGQLYREWVNWRAKHEAKLDEIEAGQAQQMNADESKD